MPDGSLAGVRDGQSRAARCGVAAHVGAAGCGRGRRHGVGSRSAARQRRRAGYGNVRPQPFANHQVARYAGDRGTYPPEGGE